MKNKLLKNPFAASIVNIVDSIVITSETDTSRVLAEWSALDPSITVYNNLTGAQSVKLFINWSDQNGAIDLQQNDYFTFVIPDIFAYEYIENITDVNITNDNDEIVATYSIYDNIDNKKEVKITFTDYVNDHSNISGNFWIVLFVGRVSQEEEKNLEFIINGEIVADGEVTVIPNNRELIPKDQKNGFSSPTAKVGDYYIFEWTVYINMTENISNGFNKLFNFSFEDILPPKSPHVFLTDEIRQNLGIPPTDYVTEIGEYIGADSSLSEDRYSFFVSQYNSNNSDIWYNFINWHTLENGLTTVGIDGNSGLNVSNIDVTEKLFSAYLGTITRPTAIKFYTISTIKMTESALGDLQVAQLFKNMFEGSSGQNLSTTLTVYRFVSGGSAQGILGDYSFSFAKVDEQGVGISGAMYSLFTSENIEVGADRFVFSNYEGVVTFNNLPEGIFYMQETTPPYGRVRDNTIYKVVVSRDGTEIYYGDNFENKLSDLDNKVVNQTEFEVTPTLVTLTGTKELTGKDLEIGMFSFVVKDNNGTIVAIGTNGPNGIINFSQIKFDSPGIYVLTVEEVVGNYDNGIEYDPSEFVVIVTVTDPGNGILAHEIEHYTGPIVFKNRYFPTPIKPCKCCCKCCQECWCPDKPKFPRCFCLQEIKLSKNCCPHEVNSPKYVCMQEEKQPKDCCPHVVKLPKFFCIKEVKLPKDCCPCEINPPKYVCMKETKHPKDC